MAEIYILSDYGKLSKKDETIVFSQSDGTNTILFPFKTEHLVLMGKISISADALRLLTKYKISTTFLSSNGRFNGKLTFGDGKNVFLRQKQFRLLDNPEKSLEIAKSIVSGKIRNEISFMQRIKRKTNTDDEKIKNAINDVKNTLSAVERASDIDSLRGFEGIAARKYFEVFSFNIQCEWAEFKKRSRNPPKTNVNAVLSFLYTLLSYRVESAIESTGMDTCCGTLHAINYGRSSLVFDLMEEFRSAICDSVCCNLFNLGTLSKDDFEQKDFSSESDDFPIDFVQDEENENESVSLQALTRTSLQGEAETISSDDEEPENFRKKQVGVLLTKQGLKKVISAFEAKMNSLIFYPPTLQKNSYAKIIYQQVLHYKRVISGEETEYKAYYFK